MHLRETLFRALSPYWAYRPLSGDGAAKFGGRFNRIGRPALYLSFSVETALNEVHQAGSFMPTTLVAVEVDLDPVLDATDPDELGKSGFALEDLALPDWAMQMDMKGQARSQEFAERVATQGYCGAIVPSFAPGARRGARNLVLWSWGSDLPARVRVVDEHERLRHPPAPPNETD
ncbi:RES family NAD+ phosphorylase [Tranquillimonas alkanivorans]|uniref:RES domain-containing protein n=1 Tax=Tranquillimonas alkanivorans TaxID=441119 RepID=A0A1I5V908_9RHOB|nr:RES domain-containing protein [Tranquillimonas alkanivorans]SFQ03416.1 RES domain-containing protein [Tranquillimonas alkanivorans]